MKIGLCLGGGGARGFAHIGVMKALEERGIEPSAIAGCSMGGIIGALVAAGLKSDDIRSRFEDLPAHRLMDAGRQGGLMGHKGVDRELTKHLPENFEDLDLPLAVTTVDVQEGRLVVLRQGELVPALRATSAVPGIFSPVSHEGRMLVDGGLLNNVPVDVITTLSLDPVVAVDVGAPPDRKLIFEDHRSFLEKLRQPTPEGQRPLTIELFMKSFDIPTAVITGLLLTYHRPQVLIRPPMDPNLKLEDFDRMEEAAEAGYEATVKALDEAELG
jgi:NTE family protein